MSKQATGGDADKLPNNFGDSMARGNSTAPKISSAAGGNATGPELSNSKGQQSNG